MRNTSIAAAALMLVVVSTPVVGQRPSSGNYDTATVQTVSGAGLFGQAIARTFTAQQDVVSRLRVTTAQFDLGQLAGQSWTASRDRALEVLSLGDLIAVGHGRPDLSRQVSAEVDTIGAAQWDGQAVWAAGVPGAELITVPDTTHYIQNQRPDVVVAAVRQVIAGT